MLAKAAKKDESEVGCPDTRSAPVLLMHLNFVEMSLTSQISRTFLNSALSKTSLQNSSASGSSRLLTDDD